MGQLAGSRIGDLTTLGLVAKVVKVAVLLPVEELAPAHHLRKEQKRSIDTGYAKPSRGKEDV